MSNTLKLFIAMWVLSTLALAQHQSQPAAVARSGGPDATAECSASSGNRPKQYHVLRDCERKHRRVQR
jgi:hypothetical protein